MRNTDLCKNVRVALSFIGRTDTSPQGRASRAVPFTRTAALKKSGKKHEDYGTNSNRNLYEVLLGRSAPTVAWHSASADAIANAKWLASRGGRSLLDRSQLAGSKALISIDQVVGMVYAKAREKNAV